MPLTPEQVAKIHQKEATTPPALKRNPLNDYTEGWFHVTLNVRGEAPVLGILAGNPEAPEGSTDAPRCVLTELGKKVEESWKRNPSIYPGVENIEFQVMPEHVHGLVHLKPGNKKTSWTDCLWFHGGMHTRILGHTGHSLARDDV